MSAIKSAVIGAGIQGQRHAQKLHALPNSKLLAVVDLNLDLATKAVAGLDAQALQDYQDLIGDVEAVVVATPASAHFEIARTLIENGVHLLIEKPIATSVEEASQLVELAESRGVVLQIGHQERFNPAVVALTKHLSQPQFVESIRISPYNARALDVSVVMDLMIHDIDLIHSFVQSPMAQVDAVGRSVFSDHIDIGNARIRFENGCVANVTSSRVSMKTERTLRVFQENSYLSADLHNKSLSAYSNRGSGPVTGPEDVASDMESFGASDEMMEQMKAFLDAITNGSDPVVSGRAGLQALQTATVIGEMVSLN